MKAPAKGGEKKKEVADEPEEEPKIGGFFSNLFAQEQDKKDKKLHTSNKASAAPTAKKGPADKKATAADEKKKDSAEKPWYLPSFMNKIGGDSSDELFE